jgi:hypothetical protein
LIMVRIVYVNIIRASTLAATPQSPTEQEA